MKKSTLLLVSILVVVASLLILGENAKAFDQLTIYLPITFRDYCPPLFADDFSNPASGWPVGDNGNIRREYLNNEYRILVRNNFWWAGARPGFKASDYILTVDVYNVTDIDSTYGLLFGLSDDWSQFYSFEISPEYGDYDISKYDDGWTSLDFGSSNSINTGTTINRLMIKRDGSLIEAYANGELLASVSDGSYTGMRNVGLIVLTYFDPIGDVMFDNFAVYPVTCNPVANQSVEAVRLPNLEITGTMEPERVFSQQNSRSR
jgi:hypothetical protein